MDFAALTQGLADACFGGLGDAAVYTRISGEVINTRGLLMRGYATEGHVSQRRLSARLPVADIVSVKRGDRLLIENETFEVTNEAGRDQIEIEVLLRAVSFAAQVLRFGPDGKPLLFDVAGSNLEFGQ